AYPDLQVSNLSVNPPSLQSGGALTVQWDNANTGGTATQGSWIDYLTITNKTTGATLRTATVAYDASAAGNGNIAPGAARPRQYTYQLPDGDPGVGNIEFAVTADYLNALPEFNAGGTGESNNTATITAASTLAPYPDLQVINVAVNPASPQSGKQVTV